MVTRTETLISFLLVIAIYVTTVQSKGSFQQLIPNGGEVPCMCGSQCSDSNKIWKAVGHYNDIGHTVPKNPFGVAFKNNNFTWTQTLCKEDSDRDGVTNGVELGDPDCTWTPGQTTLLPKPKGHPGICEPIGAVKCQYQKFSCDCLINLQPCIDNNLV